MIQEYNQQLDIKLFSRTIIEEKKKKKERERERFMRKTAGYTLQCFPTGGP